MGNFVANRSKGRFVEFGERVNANDPTNSVLVLDVLATSGVESDATLLDKDAFSDLVSGATNFVTQSSIRKTIDQSGGITITYDDTNDRVDVDIPDQTWTAVAAGDGWNDLVVGYDSDSTGGTDANIVFVSQHDFVVTPDGSDITAVIAAAGILRAA
jgi:hypothetical protein